MGNGICRIILAREAESTAPATFAEAMRHKVTHPTQLYLRDLHSKSVRKSHLVAARDAGLRILDISRLMPADVLMAGATSAFGEGGFVIRMADDEGIDITLPGADSLLAFYPGADLSWLLEPQEDVIPWNSKPFYLFPGNPPVWSLSIPVLASLLKPATPGLSRPCPICGTSYTTKGERGQCPSCGSVSMPFRSLAEAKQILKASLDAWGHGSCPRCQKSREWTCQIEQCFNCGQIVEGDSGRYKLDLADNKAEIIQLLESL